MPRAAQPDAFLRRSSRSHHGRLAGGDLSAGADIGPGSALGGREGGDPGAASARLHGKYPIRYIIRSDTLVI
jgi:hypothetical protein